jgi:dephospho-CoA kinase
MSMILFPPMLLVGLTGNIASGKTCAATLFAELGAHVLDADCVARELFECGTGTYRSVVKAFGVEILNPDGSIDRKRLGEIVFSDKEKRLLLNQLTHADVVMEIELRIRALERLSPEGIIIVDAALIVEVGAHEKYQRLIVTACSPALQLSRLMIRNGLTETEAQARIASQLPVEEKVKVAHYTIDTSGTMEQTRRQVEAIYRDLVDYEQRLKRQR